MIFTPADDGSTFQHRTIRVRGTTKPAAGYGLFGRHVFSLLFVVAPSADLQDFLNWQNAVIYGVMIALTATCLPSGDVQHASPAVVDPARAVAARTRTRRRCVRPAAEGGHSDAGSIGGRNGVQRLDRSQARAEDGAQLALQHTEMLRTLVVSGSVPLAVGLVRVLTAWLGMR